MKNFKFIILITALTFIIIQCSSETDENKKAISPQDELYELDLTDLQVQMNNEILSDVSFHLAYNFEEGETFSYRITTLSTTERDIQSDSVVIDRFEQKIIRILNFEILSVENDSIAKIKCNISKVNVNVNLNSQKVVYQSGVTTNPVELKKFTEHEGLVNNPFHFRITNYGEILEIFNVENILDRFLELSEHKDSIRAEEKKMMKVELENGLLKPLVGQILREIPKKELRIKSTWQKTIDPASIMIFKIYYTDHFTVNKVAIVDDDRIALINGKATSVIEGEKEHTNNGIKYEFNQPLSEANSEIYFNIDKGLVYKSSSTTNLKLSYRMEVPSAEGTKISKSNELITNTNIVELL